MVIHKDFIVNLDLEKSSVNERFEVVEGDNANGIIINLTKDGVPVDLSEATRIVAVFSNADGTAEQDTEDALYELSSIGISVARTPEYPDSITVSSNDGVVEIESYTAGLDPVVEDAELFLEAFPESGEYAFTFDDVMLMWKHGENSVMIDGEDTNRIYIVLKPTSYAPSGLNQCEIQIYSEDGNFIATTPKFNFTSRRAILNDETIRSYDKFPILASLISSVKTALNTALDVIAKWVTPSATATSVDTAASVTIDEDSGGNKRFNFSIPKNVYVGNSTPPVDSIAEVWVKPTGGEYVVYYKDNGSWVGAVAGGGVNSVNGETGTVVLDADDVGAIPVGEAIPISKLPSVITVTLLAANWSSKAQTISNAGFVTSGFAYQVSPDPSDFTEYGESQIYADNVTVSGQMTFHCDSEPANDLSVNILKVGV